MYSMIDKRDSYLIEDPIERAERWIEEKRQMQMLEAENKAMLPKAEYFDALVDSKLLTTFRDCAKELNVKQNVFTKWLADNGFIYYDRHGIIKPYSPHVKSGLFSMKDFKTPFGYSNVQTYITVKGKETFRLMLGMI